MSYGWWLHKHSRHHGKPNQVGAHPDLATGALISHTGEPTRAAQGLRPWVARRQGWLFLPLLAPEGLNLHVSPVRMLLG